MLRWPTSELPIWPSGRPTCISDASIVPCAWCAMSALQFGMRASEIALSGAAGREPNPSRITRTTGRGAGAAVADAGAGGDIVAIILPMTPIEFALKEWPLVAVAVVSGTMLVWPLVARRMSPMKEVGTHAATQLINRDALVLDVREQKELEADRGKLPHAVHIPLSELDKRIGEIAARAGKPVV